MAASSEYQALYRRYRPQRFDELRGQDHVARALKNAVANERIGHAYLFSGPRGTGKTTTARILAKVLNCEATVDGEPCCTCSSCVAVQSGSSFDVIELDAASNRSIEDIREIIATAALGSPGRHKVYILDEVHQLTAPAAAALLKTLEEPPSHVVFVLATTDPEKVPETIRSRTQHLQFHLLPVDDLEKHVKWVASDAGIELDERGLESVLRQGGGSARDTLSALELLAATGGALDESTPVDEFVEALIDHDAGRLLAAVAETVYHGRDPRSIVDDLVRHLRDCFLTQMAPELVQVQQHRAEVLADQSRRLGTARIVKIIETLGTALLEMRGAPDQRVILEVALVRLVHRQLDTGLDGLLARVEKLERDLAERGAAPAPAPVNPSTGRAVLGGRIARDPSGSTIRPDTSERSDTTGGSPRPEPAVASETPSSAPASTGGSAQAVVDGWADLVGSFAGMRRAVAQMAKPMLRDDAVILVVDNEHAAKRVREYIDDITTAVHKAAGVRCAVEVEVADEKPAPKRKKASDPLDEHEMSIDDIKKLPTATAKSAEEELLDAFPDAKFITEDS
ncbi:MAG: DNA polymerase III subunit gamma/tau [Ilumatobacteraceae bacterium]|jgi:DNA polymerase-3 subunit gamma/tau|nr:DNA polymerase III subunit gamma/tau [Actinomycetota bacterium]MDA3011316.1 DNA polymerase III subunit gamma/tau [Actinomycetota bacterium]MDA3024308.1 DNA polymerase III subunit gamma/tau [Actinomycetota bacterium]